MWLGLLLDPQRGALGAEHARRHLDAAAEHVLRRLRRRELAARLEQRVRDLSRLLRGLGLEALLLVEARVLERDRCLAGEHLEQADVVLVELVHAELRDHDHAGDARAVAERHHRQRLLELVGAGDPDRELALERIRHEQRLARLGDATGDAHADLRRVRVRRVADARAVVADERDRAQLVAVAQGDAAVVVVDQEPQLGRDRRADLLDVVQPVELAGERLQHLQVRDRAHVARRARPGPLGRTVVVEHDLVLAARLRRHHRGLGASDQLARVHRVLRALRDADRHRHGTGRLEAPPRAGAPCSRAARPRASPASHDGMITPNSSPPIRQTTSEPRTVSSATRATCE